MGRGARGEGPCAVLPKHGLVRSRFVVRVFWCLLFSLINVDVIVSFASALHVGLTALEVTEPCARAP